MSGTSLKNVELGKTGIEITPIGLGTWAMGGPAFFGWGPQDDETSCKTILRAVELGINWLDSAAIYGLGHAETVVGKALAQLDEGERPAVFTKCGLVWDDSDEVVEPAQVGNARSVRRECEDSLRRLGVERIDLYQIHHPPEDGTRADEVWATLLELVDEGKIRAAGVSNYNVDQLKACNEIAFVNSVQVELSLIKRESASEVIPWCYENGSGVLVYSPIYSGMLSGTMSKQKLTNLPADDWRTTGKQFSEPMLSRNLAVAEELKKVAAELGQHPAAVAIAWTLAWSGVTGAIAGARNPEQIQPQLSAATLELPGSVLDRLADAIRSNGAGVGEATRPK